MIPLSHAGRDVTGSGFGVRFFTRPVGVSVSLLNILRPAERIDGNEILSLLALGKLKLHMGDWQEMSSSFCFLCPEV